MTRTTDIPPQITTPTSVETRIGTLKFLDGFPDDKTTQLVYDKLTKAQEKARIEQKLK
jgi:hypothetical protein